jgi:hypothetical protein
MSKFLLNLLLQIPEALVNSKIQFLIRKLFSLLSPRPTPQPVWPLAHPAHRPCHPCRLKQSLPAHPAHASIASSREIRFPFRITPSEPAASPLSLCQPGPTCKIHPLPHAGRPWSEISPRRRSPTPLPRALDAPELLQPSLITLPP